MKYILRVAFNQDVGYQPYARVAGIFLEIEEGEYDYDLSKVMKSIIENMLDRSDPFMFDLHDTVLNMREPESFIKHIQKRFKGSILRFPISYLEMDTLEDHINKVANNCIKRAISESRLGNREYGPSFNAQIIHEVIVEGYSKTNALLKITFS